MCIHEVVHVMHVCDVCKVLATYLDDNVVHTYLYVRYNSQLLIVYIFYIQHDKKDSKHECVTRKVI